MKATPTQPIAEARSGAPVEFLTVAHPTPLRSIRRSSDWVWAKGRALEKQRPNIVVPPLPEIPTVVRTVQFSQLSGFVEATSAADHRLPTIITRTVDVINATDAPETYEAFETILASSAAKHLKRQKVTSQSATVNALIHDLGQGTRRRLPGAEELDADELRPQHATQSQVVVSCSGRYGATHLAAPIESGRAIVWDIGRVTRSVAVRVNPEGEEIWTSRSNVVLTLSFDGGSVELQQALSLLLATAKEFHEEVKRIQLLPGIDNQKGLP